MKLFNFSHPLSEDAKRRLVEVVQIDYEDFNEEIFKFQLDMSDNVVGQVLNSVIENIISKVANEKYLYDKNAREEDAFLIVLPSLSIAAGIFAAMLQNAKEMITSIKLWILSLLYNLTKSNRIARKYNEVWLRSILELSDLE